MSGPATHIDIVPLPLQAPAPTPLSPSSRSSSVANHVAGHLIRWLCRIGWLNRLRWELALRSQAARRHLALAERASDRQTRRHHLAAELAVHLPFGIWARIGAPDAPSLVAGIGHRSPRPLTFLQVGSNDGVSHDPLHATVRRHHWRGVLVEPIPELFHRLKSNYADVEGVAFENAAIGDREGSIDLFIVDPEPGDPGWVSQIASFDREVILRHHNQMPGLEERVRAVPVASVTVPDLVARHHLGLVDVLHVDAEGFDLHVLDQLDLDALWAPQYVVFEKKHLHPGDYREALAKFRRAGYRRIKLWPDELWYRPAP